MSWKLREKRVPGPKLPRGWSWKEPQAMALDGAVWDNTKTILSAEKGEQREREQRERKSCYYAWKVMCFFCPEDKRVFRIKDWQAGHSRRSLRGRNNASHLNGRMDSEIWIHNNQIIHNIIDASKKDFARPHALKIVVPSLLCQMQ